MVKRGTGRQGLIDATAEVLRRGGEVQIKEVAAEVGVSHTLVYRHFPEGGKDELVAEAYAQVFRGLVQADVDWVSEILNTRGLNRESLREFASAVLDPSRDDVRWARLEALSQVRTNPYLASLIEDVRSELIDNFADRLQLAVPNLDRTTARAISLVSQALPLGITALGGRSLPAEERERMAELWSHFLAGALESYA